MEPNPPSSSHTSRPATGLSADEVLTRYLHAGEQQRATRAKAMWDTLTPREQNLIREGAVLGYVEGRYSAPKTPTTSRALFPSDQQIVTQVLTSADNHSDLYPTLAALSQNQTATEEVDPAAPEEDAEDAAGGGQRENQTAADDSSDRRLLESILGNIWLHTDHRHLTQQMTTEQKERFADAVDAWRTRLNANETNELAENEAAPGVERWWRT